nr:hypothetical protein [Tanacetum cinerariifolium]
KDSQPESKSKEQETPKKSQVKYPEQIRHLNKRPKGNQRRRVQRETNRSQNHSYKSSTYRSTSHRPNGAHIRPPLRSSGPRPHGDSMRPSFRPAGHRPHGPPMNPRIPTMNGMIPLLIENFPLVEDIFLLPIGNFPLLAEEAQNITLLIWEGREKLAAPRTTLMTKVIGTVAALGT